MKYPNELKKEINSIIQLQHITQAFEQSAAIYIMRTKKKILNARPFVEQAWKTYNIIRFLSLPKERGVPQRLILVITPNQGMYGSLMWKIVEKVHQLEEVNHGELAIIGQKGRQYFSQDDNRIKKKFVIKDDFIYQDLVLIAETLIAYSDISLVYPKYESVFHQEIAVAELKSDKRPESHREVIEDIKRYTLDPDLKTLFQYFDKTILAIMLYRYCLEALSAYKAAQMIAMKRAYDNTRKELEDAQFNYYRTVRSLIDNRIREISVARAIWEGTT